IGGQSAALFVVHFGLNYRLPLLRCLIAILSSAALNALLAIRFPATPRLRNRDATLFLGFDVLQLGALLYLTGGIENPFSLMFLAPVVIAAATLYLGNTLILAALALASASFIALVHYPLPWVPGQQLDLPPLYQGGIWASLVIGIGFTSIYAWRIASEASRMSAGLAATQLALAREHRLGSLGALATAAAHELGTPLGTIAVVARELERALPATSPEADDVRPLREQAERCRAIPARIGEPYVTSRPSERFAGEDRDASGSEREGMGLGFFIAKVLLEQTGGAVKAVNLPDHGANVSVSWLRGLIDGETPPSPKEAYD